MTVSTSFRCPGSATYFLWMSDGPDPQTGGELRQQSQGLRRFGDGEVELFEGAQAPRQAGLILATGSISPAANLR